MATQAVKAVRTKGDETIGSASAKCHIGPTSIADEVISRESVAARPGPPMVPTAEEEVSTEGLLVLHPRRGLSTPGSARC